MLHWIDDALSREQKLPFRRASRNTCILAGAGSGKTRTLIHLLAADLAAQVLPSEIVAFTFTEKAADELLNRVYALAAEHLPGIQLESMYVGTIHAWCLQYLREQEEYYGCQATIRSGHRRQLEIPMPRG